MEFQVLISTYKSRVFKNIPLVNRLAKSNHIIINQKPDTSGLSGNLKVINSDDVGLVKSRNMALSHASGDICLVGDYDIQYLSDFKETITNAFSEIPDADVITFQIVATNGSSYKKYKNKVFKHNYRSILKVSSVEMAFKLESIKKNAIKFNEKFGINAKYVSGEEPVFLRDCIKKGLSAYHYPVFICKHPVESSGKNFKNYENLKAKGAMLREIFGVFGCALSVLFLVKNYKRINGFYRSAVIMLRGAIENRKVS